MVQLKFSEFAGKFANSRLISGGVWLYGGKYPFLGGNTTFRSVVWAVGLISRSDLVQVVVYGKCECLCGCK